MGFFSKKEIDPICKMKVDPATAQWKLEWAAKMYYFCSPGCERQFSADPSKFVKTA